MPAPGYLTSCPDCGKELVHHVGGPDEAPWVCGFATGGCGFAFWQAQLSPEGRASRRPTFRDHAGSADGMLFDAEILARCYDERTIARRRGTSVLPEFLDRLSLGQLSSLITLLTPRAQVTPQAAALLRAAQAALVAMGG